jgi:hypothetical protein
MDKDDELAAIDNAYQWAFRSLASMVLSQTVASGPDFDSTAKDFEKKYRNIKAMRLKMQEAINSQEE